MEPSGNDSMQLAMDGSVRHPAKRPQVSVQIRRNVSLRKECLLKQTALIILSHIKSYCPTVPGLIIILRFGLYGQLQTQSVQNGYQLGYRGADLTNLHPMKVGRVRLRLHGQGCQGDAFGYPVLPHKVH